MQTVKTILIVISSVYLLIYLIFLICTKKPIRTALLLGLIGIVSLAAINLTAKFTGLKIPLNYHTVLFSLCGGVGGTVLSLLLRLLFL